ncbi:MAG TPA: phosphonoacetaldehyde hydrolase [Devosiaceae bacterium]|jgi:phosphonoacetaldehyde hydrolase
MPQSHHPIETGIRAVVFDWAGTVIDHGSRAPMAAFVEAFRRFGVDLTIAEARIPMGLPKRSHIEALLRLPGIATAWSKIRGAVPAETDIDAIYDVFVPLNEASVAHHCDMIPGAVEIVTELRRRDIRIGSTTGYTRSIMDRVLPLAASQGYAPDNLVCADDLPHGRPTPMGMYRCFLDLDVWPAAAVIKVDDTVPGIAEGVAAGCWTVGVTLSGNSVGLSAAETAALSPEERQRLHTEAAAALAEAGADFVVPSVAALLPVVEQINQRLRSAAGR